MPSYLDVEGVTNKGRLSVKKIKLFTRICNLTLISVFLSKAAYCQQQVSEKTKEMFTPGIETTKKLISIAVEFLVKYSFQVLGGLIILVAGIFISKIAGKMLSQLLEKHKLDITVSKFIVQMVKIVIIAFAALIALGNFGITILPFIAGLSVVGVGLSFALQGPLSNYAAGVTLIFIKPFKVGDIIEVTDAMGEVIDMTLARTELKTVDGTVIFIPNKQIVGEVIHNYSDFKKLDIKVGVSYEADVAKAIEIIKNIVRKNSHVAEKPEPKIGISEFADSSINIYARTWCKQVDYWDLMFDINKAIRDEFKNQGVTIPFPQRDVHIYEEKKK